MKMKQKDNNIGDSGVKMIVSEVLKSNSTLTVLYLSSDEKDKRI